MSEYIDEVKKLVRGEAQKYGLKILPRGKSSFSLMKGGQIYMTIRDTGDNVEISFQGSKYLYDKFYTKPEHLAQVIFNVLEAQHREVKEES
ncbi:MAG: hypothetical protein F7C82_03995 [Desulfurococcales archaeon]|nr:hypothetical protein [Desulfurococcales archaeon]MCE4621919.1 hypothetical protein [Desulfurococcales archaeon]MCE4629420.1 hypothetical protein [Desulfurococcales archaeon]NOZ30371.1 hypothetical protein [Thermoproteota archaeon]